MDLQTAVQIVLAECERLGPKHVAESLNVSESTLSRWKHGVPVTRDRQRRAVLSFAADVVANRMAPPEVIAAAVAETAANVKRLAQIQGYAQAVYDALMDAAKRQHAVITMLEPHVNAESRHFAMRMQQAATDDEATATLREQLDTTSGRPATPPADPLAVPPRRQTKAP